MKISSAFPSRFVKADDLPHGKQVEVEIKEVAFKEIGTDKDKKPVVYFTGKDKGLVLNKTNAMIIAESFGDDTGGWIGKNILLVASETPFQGKIVPCIRVRIPATATAEAAPSSAPANNTSNDSDIPF